MADSAASTTVQPTDTPQAGAEQAQSPAPTPAPAEGATSTATAEPGQQQQTTAEAKPAGADWARRRINELTAAKYRERARAEALERELEAYRQQLQQLQRGGAAPAPSDQPQNPTPRPDVVEKVAEQIVREREFVARCNQVAEAGAKEFKDFSAAMANVSSVAELFDPQGRATPAMEAIIAAEAPHKVLYHFGTHPDEAAQILSLPPLQLARAIGALEARLASKPAPVTTSNAPAPITPIGEGSGDATGSKPSEKDDIGTWIAKRREQLYGKR